MNRCARFRDSSTVKCFTTANRHYTASLSAVKPQNDPSTEEEARPAATRTLFFKYVVAPGKETRNFTRPPAIGQSFIKNPYEEYKIPSGTVEQRRQHLPKSPTSLAAKSECTQSSDGPGRDLMSPGHVEVEDATTKLSPTKPRVVCREWRNRADSESMKPEECEKKESQAPAHEPRPLPLSPFMDPDVNAAREKWHITKAPPSKTPTPFQQLLAKNPYAQALATPLRMCQITKVVLPNFFLQDFNIIAHPETGDPWYQPRSLTTKHTTYKPEVGSLPIMSTDLLPSGKELRKNTPTIGPNGYTLARKSLIRSLQTRQSGNENGWERLPSARSRKFKEYAKVLAQTSWRGDMDDFVLKLMRRRAVEAIIYLMEVRRGYVVRCWDWEEVKIKPQVGMILWLWKTESSKNEVVELGSNEEPPEFATLELGTWKKHMVPVHNLQWLLGKEQCAKLKRIYPQMFNTGIVVIRHRRLTVDLQLRLWKLQGYLAEYANMST